MQNIVFILIGGSAGVLSRYYLSNFINSMAAQNMKFGTIVVNLIGSFIIGAVWAYTENRNLDPKTKNMITTGFLGCFTTFSTFSLETMQYMSNNEYAKALVNILISNVLGIVLVFAGYFAVKNLLNN